MERGFLSVVVTLLLAFMLAATSANADSISVNSGTFSPYDFDRDGDLDVFDVDILVTQSNLRGGLSTPPFDQQFDLDNDQDIDVDDLAVWLVIAAAANRVDGSYLAGDTDLDLDIDITDFNNLVSNFDPGGLRVALNGLSRGNSDGDNDVDISDFNALISNFAPGGYASYREAQGDLTVAPLPSAAAGGLVLLAGLGLAAARRRREHETAQAAVLIDWCVRKSCTAATRGWAGWPSH